MNKQARHQGIRLFIFIQVIFLYSTVNSQNITITQTKTSPWRWNGGVQLGTQVYKAFGMAPRMNQPAWNIYGNMSLSYKDWLTLPFSFSVGHQGSHATYPVFNQFGASPKFGFVTIHGGWRRLRFSDFTLNDHTFLGGGVEVNPGKLRLAAMYGRFKKGRDAGELFGEFLPGQYQRTGYAAKIGYGTERNFVDIIYMKIKDAPNSLPEGAVDSLITPAENAVVGINTKIAVSSFFSWYGEVAVSAFTRDIRSHELEDSGNYPGLYRNILTPRLSTKTNYALKSGIEAGSQNARIRLQYERIMPEYETMGSFFFMNDLENFTVAPTLSLFQRKLNINGQVGVQKNNLLNTRSETTKRFIGAGNVSYQPNPVFGIDFNFNSMNIDQQQARVRFSDTIRTALISTNYQLSPRWIWVQDTSSVRSLISSINYQKLNDRNPFTRAFTNMNTWFALVQYNHQINLLKMNWMLGINYNIIQLPDFNTTRIGVSGGVDKSIWKQKVQLSTQATFNLSAIEKEADGSFTTFLFSATYTPIKRHTIQANVSVLFNQSRQFGNFTEVIGQLTYGYQFFNQ